jgi:hypothetical protein
MVRGFFGLAPTATHPGERNEAEHHGQGRPGRGLQLLADHPRDSVGQLLSLAPPHIDALVKLGHSHSNPRLRAEC